MKLATICIDGVDRVAALTGDGSHVIDLAAAANGLDGGAFGSMLRLIEHGPPALDLARHVTQEAEASGSSLLPVAELDFRAPLPIPAQMRDFSLFPTHIVQSRQGMERLALELLHRDISNPDAPAGVPSLYRQQPVYYFTNRFSVTGPDTEVWWPRYSRYMDFELELAAVIGIGGRDISPDTAASHIFGYTIYNDFSARDTQLVEMAGMLGPAKGKSFDAGNAMGPVIVTRDEIADVRALRVRARVNGQLWADEDCGAMLHSFEEMIAYVSRDETLHPGEVFGSGTIGNCCGLESSRYLDDGDVVELEVDPIGILRNRVRRQSPHGARGALPIPSNTRASA